MEFEIRRHQKLNSAFFSESSKLIKNIFPFRVRLGYEYAICGLIHDWICGDYLSFGEKFFIGLKNILLNKKINTYISLKKWNSKHASYRVYSFFRGENFYNNEQSNYVSENSAINYIINNFSYNCDFKRHPDE
jgi:hypothetical protein